jgi:hypothetical protein
MNKMIPALCPENENGIILKLLHFNYKIYSIFSGNYRKNCHFERRQAVVREFPLHLVEAK